MAEQLPDGIMKPGHHIDPGPFLLDLYRLLCIVVADKEVAQIESASLLQGSYRDTEVIRILISGAIQLSSSLTPICKVPCRKTSGGCQRESKHSKFRLPWVPVFVR